MARNLAHKLGINRDSEAHSKKFYTRNKEHLNRRELLQLGAIGSGAVVGVGTLFSGVSAGTQSDGNTYTTNFEEYAL